MECSKPATWQMRLRFLGLRVVTMDEKRTPFEELAITLSRKRALKLLGAALLEAVMNLSLARRPLGVGTGTRRLQSVGQPPSQAAARNPLPNAESVSPTRNPARLPTASVAARSPA